MDVCAFMHLLSASCPACVCPLDPQLTNNKYVYKKQNKKTILSSSEIISNNYNNYSRLADYDFSSCGGKKSGTFKLQLNSRKKGRKIKKDGKYEMHISSHTRLR